MYSIGRLVSIPVLFVLILFRHFGIVFLYLISLVGRLLGYT